MLHLQGPNMQSVIDSDVFYTQQKGCKVYSALTSTLRFLEGALVFFRFVMGGAAG